MPVDRHDPVADLMGVLEKTQICRIKVKRYNRGNFRCLRLPGGRRSLEPLGTMVCITQVLLFSLRHYTRNRSDSFRPLKAMAAWLGSDLRFLNQTRDKGSTPHCINTT